MPDVVAPKVHQNNCSYVSLAHIHYVRIYHGGRLHSKTMKTTKLSKLGGWALARDNTAHSIVFKLHVQCINTQSVKSEDENYCSRAYSTLNLQQNTGYTLSGKEKKKYSSVEKATKVHVHL